MDELEGNWIECEDRLPEEDRVVIMQDDKANGLLFLLYREMDDYFWAHNHKRFQEPYESLRRWLDLDA